ncbi:cytochrome C [Azonexus sp.]|uniref:cytochrome C n=1 Tax=Azonexus sp. TaxID=1872668 RepID=UPI0035B47970
MKKLIFALLAAVTVPALADRLPQLADTPASYRDECGSCHLAYPPALLAAGDWQRLLAGLNDHFGSDAAVDATQQREIAAFLTRHAGNPGAAGNPPRITRTARFVRKHDEIPARFWRDPRVRSPANCEACHTRAGEGRFSEHEIGIAELRE